MTYEKDVDALTEDLIETWDAIADMGESDLLDALGEASEKGESALARRIFEGAIRFVAEELISRKEE